MMRGFKRSPKRQVQGSLSHKKVMRPWVWTGVLASIAFQFAPSTVWAGFFTMPHFVPQGQFTLGLEPEIAFTSGGSFGTNFRYTQGLNETSNITGVFGTGSGSRGLRGAVAMTFDVFPDSAKQPGVGFGAMGNLMQRDNLGEVGLGGFAYIHKNFELTNNYIKAVEPFLAVPLALELLAGGFRMVSAVSLGTMFLHNPHLRSVLEVTVGINGSDTLISGGVAYYP